MIQAQALPPGKSVYDYPAIYPGQPLNEEQEKQAQVAQIAGIVLAAAAGKKALTDAVTNQIVAMLRVTDLTSTVAVALFAKQASFLVRLAVRQSQMIAWSGVSARAAVVGISLGATPPAEESIPADLRFSRGTDLETAYKRLASEYQKYMAKTEADPMVQELIRQYEAQSLSPLPRPDNISNDAIQRVTNGEEEWQKAFARASEEALKDEGRKVTIFETDEEETEARIRAQTAAARAEQDARESAVATAERDAGAGEDSSSQSPGEDSEPDADGEDSEPEFKLTASEITEVIERLAEQKTEERAENMVSHDVQAASRNMHQVAMRQIPAKKVTGFRRVVHPELAKSGYSCGLCIVASTMRYTRRDLLPIHSGCNCETCEIYMIDGVEFDPGEQINMEDLAVFYREAGDSTFGWDLKRGRYQVIDHPEYGPTLVNIKTDKMTENVPFEKKDVSNDN